MKKTFRDFRIKRTCTKSFEDYHSYKRYLEEDFCHRCAYCNLLDILITTPFEVDHMIPRDTFKDRWKELDTTYENLVYACKKCNMAKGSQFEGDIGKGIIENELFYDPEEVDYNEIFYRDDVGGICSDDEKGRDMINRIQLYRPIHNLAWLCEEISKTLDKLKAQIEREENEERRNLLMQARSALLEYHKDCMDVFLANYNNRDFIKKDNV